MMISVARHAAETPTEWTTAGASAPTAASVDRFVAALAAIERDDTEASVERFDATLPATRQDRPDAATPLLPPRATRPPTTHAALPPRRATNAAVSLRPPPRTQAAVTPEVAAVDALPPTASHATPLGALTRHERDPQFITSDTWAARRDLVAAVARLQAERIKAPLDRQQFHAVAWTACSGAIVAAGASITAALALCGPQAGLLIVYACFAGVGLVGARVGQGFEQHYNGPLGGHQAVAPHLLHSSTLSEMGLGRSKMGTRRLLDRLTRDGVCRQVAAETYEVKDLSAWPRSRVRKWLTSDQAMKLHVLLSHAARTSKTTGR